MAKHVDTSNSPLTAASEAEASRSVPDTDAALSKTPKDTEVTTDAVVTRSTDEKTLQEADTADAAAAKDVSSPAAKDHGQGDDDATEDHADGHAKPFGLKRLSTDQRVLAAGSAALVVLGCLAGWLGYRTYEGSQAQAERNLLVAVARQGALNLTTIDYTRVDADVRRILDSSVGSFHDDFQNRSQPFVDVVKKAQSKSEGTVTAAGLETRDGDHAQVLVAVTVKTSNAGAPEQDPRRWRMRITVQKVGDGAKVSDVKFVPEQG